MNFDKELVADKIYIDKHMTLLSIVELEGLKNWNDWMKEVFPAYRFAPEENHKMVPETAQTLSYGELRKFLLSKNLSNEQKQEFEERYSKCGPLLLNGEEKVPTIGLSTFHRSGNSLTRKYFEFLTGSATGSNMSIEAPASMAFMPMGFLAERYYNDNIWMFKTHIPMTETCTVTDPKGYDMAKAVVVVRNPLDVA